MSGEKKDSETMAIRMGKRGFLGRLVLVAALALALVAGVTACAPASSQSTTANTSDGAVTFTDDLGNEVTISNPERVVAVMGSFANMWELAGGELVGASDDAFTSYAIHSDAEMVGDFANPNLEAIIALEPDFVILTSGSGGRGGNSSQADLESALQASDIPYAYFNITTFDDYQRMMGILTQITGRDDLYQANVADVAENIQSVIASVPEGEDPTVLLMISYSGGVRVQDSSSQTGAILKDLGAVNIADENPSLLSDFSVEALVEADPDFIFVLPMGNSAASAEAALAETLTDNPAWSTLSAVQNGDYVVLEPDLYLYKPNERWAEPYQELYGYLYD